MLEIIKLNGPNFMGKMKVEKGSGGWGGLPARPAFWHRSLSMYLASNHCGFTVSGGKRQCYFGYVVDVCLHLWAEHTPITCWHIYRFLSKMKVLEAGTRDRKTGR